MSIIENLHSTRFINISTFEWPVMFSDIQRLNPLVFWPAQVSEEELITLGYAVIHPRAPVTGDVVTETDPEYIEGQFFQRWSARSFTPEEIQQKLDNQKSVLAAQVVKLKNETMAKGYPYQFIEGRYHIQLRDTDRVNILGMSEKSTRAAGLIQTFRTYENVNVSLDDTEMFKMSAAAGDAYSQLMAKVWEFKDQINQATTEAGLPQIPTTLDAFYADHLQWYVAT